MPAGRKALVVATYAYSDDGLQRLAAPEHDAESFAAVLKDPAIAGFDVTMLVNQPHHVVGEAIADFYTGSRSDDLTLLYFSGHGLKDDEGRLYLAMTNTRREALMFTAISGAQLNDAMDASRSRRKVLILDCCYSGAFPAGRTAKADEGVQTLERFQGKGRAVLTASDATQYAFEGDDLRGSATSSVFTRHLVQAISTGAADLDEDGDIALDELYSYVYERVVAEMPQQRPKKQEDVDGRILIARNVHWTLPGYLQHAIESPIAAQRLNALQELEHLHVAGNDVVRAAVAERVVALASDDSRSVSAAATSLLERLGRTPAPATAIEVRAPRTAVEEPVPVPSTAGPVVRPEPPPRSPVREPSRIEPPMASPSVPAASPSVPAASPSAPAASPERGAGSGWSAPALVLALVLGSALPLALSRLLAFEATIPSTADEFSESTTQWSMVVVAPLVVAVALLAARSRYPALVPPALGVVWGVGLALAEHAGYWIFWFIVNADGYDVGPGMVLLVVGAALVAAAGVVAASRGPLAGRPTLRADWRVACALLIVTAAVLSLAYGPESYSVPEWVANSVGTLLLAGVALPLALLRLRADQRLAALVAVLLFGVWLVYFPLGELLAESSRLGLEPSVWVARIVGVVLTLVACLAAQAGRPSAPRATSSDPR